MNTTDADLAAMKARADTATPGPWISDPDEPKYILKPDKPGSSFDGTIIARIQHDDFGLIESANAEFIAHSREDVPDLLTEVAALRKQIDLADKAPHDRSCKYGSFFAVPASDRRDNGGAIPCTCWKAEYDAAKEAL